jgi:hypothetical protein
MEYDREIGRVIKEQSKYFPVVAVTGPRQAGKTTLIRFLYPKYEYRNLENLAVLEAVKADPLGVLKNYRKGLIIDEIQRFPEMLSYIQASVDEEKIMGKLVISGSQNLLISEKIAQTLAGRAAYSYMYPMSLSELRANKLVKKNVYEQMRYGGYPAIYDRNIPPAIYYEQYLSTYIERDVRMMRNVRDLSQFRKLLILLAGRVGQLVNLNSLSSDIGVSSKTVEDWISILEASYIVFRHQPYFRNIGKRLIKSPKIYFYDTGVLCHLLGIADEKTLESHYAVGSIYENLVIADVIKELKNQGSAARTYFYRDSNGNEVDLIIQKGEKFIPIEIKLSSTFSRDFLKGIQYWKKLVSDTERGWVIYTGDSTKIGNDRLLNWLDLGKKIHDLV